MSDFLRKKKRGSHIEEGRQEWKKKKVKDKFAFLSACLECLPHHLPPGHSFPLPRNGHAMHFTIRLVSHWKTGSCEAARSWHAWCLFRYILVVQVDGLRPLNVLNRNLQRHRGGRSVFFSGGACYKEPVKWVWIRFQEHSYSLTMTDKWLRVWTKDPNLSGETDPDRQNNQGYVLLHFCMLQRYVSLDWIFSCMLWQRCADALVRFSHVVMVR